MVLAALLAVAVLAALAATPGQAEESRQAPDTRKPLATDRAYTVTLISGDRVRVQPRKGTRPTIAVLPAKGRSAVRFFTQRVGSAGLRVIPTDALPLIATDRLDPRLFDVALLGTLRYDDAHRRSLPLIVTGARGRAPHAFAATGTNETRTLPRIGATIVQQDKRTTGSFWSSMTAGVTAKGVAPRMTATGVRKIWLSSAFRPSLDRSVPQIGGPTAWKAGYTGKGVRVAILDSGIDAKHPDFRGVIAASKDFSGSSVGVQDEIGHGTHVASIVAGRGTASHGKYTGVAKGARLLIGKVCGDFFCTEDAILAGMEWAATTEKAKVANLSLGGPVGDGLDPVVSAVDFLTADTGTLFVIAAGNEGPTAETVSSPATASSALAVGSVDRKDELSFFSSRGPRVNASRRLDYAIKPDLTAPGEDIVAAQAQGIPPLGEPVGKWYQALSGTSMATPHVTGSVAILAQEHPDFTAAQLKAALMSTATPNAKASVYEQGAGRVDIGRAALQKVYAEQGSLSLGYFPWPHRAERPATQSVTYRNVGTTPVTLALTPTFTDAKGAPAAAGVLTIGRESVTVPAKGTATVPVTVAPGKAGIGLYGGRLQARSADGKVTVTTALGIYKEPESYNLDLTALGTAGQAADFSLAVVVDPKTGETRFLFLDGGTGVIRLPRADYVLFSLVGGSDSTKVGIDVRKLSIRRTSSVILDARRGNQVSLTAPGVADAVPDDFALFGVDYSTPDYGLGIGVIGPPQDMIVMQPRGRVAGLTWAFLAEMIERGTGTPAHPTPYVYHGAFIGRESLPARPRFRFDAANTAIVTHHFSRQTANETLGFGAMSWTSSWGMGVMHPVGSLTERTDHYSTSPDVSWSGWFGQGDAPAPDQFSDTADIESEPVPYRAGQKLSESWNTAVFGPAVPAGAGSRYRDELFVAMATESDSRPGHFGFPFSAYDKGGATLYRGDTVVATATDAAFMYAAGLPAADAEYRLVSENSRVADWAKLGTHTTVVWTFHSADPGDNVVGLPLAAVRFAPQLDALNRAPNAGKFEVPVRWERQEGSAPAEVESLTVEASYDDGKTWVDVPLTGSGATRTATLTHPGHSGYVSLRTTAVATDGSAVKQTLIHAYALR